MIVCVSLSLIFATSLEVLTDAGSVKGIYSLMKSGDFVNAAAVKLPFVEGVSIRATWKTIEPEQGHFDWSYLDRALAETRVAHKKAMLRILPGVHSPAWLGKTGIHFLEIKDTNKFHKSFGRTLRIPLAWDEAYLDLWMRFIAQLGARYSNHEELQLVHIAGPTVHSAEMHLPKHSSENREILIEAGYGKDNIVSAWKKVIDAYAVAFPGKSLALNIAVPFKDDGAMEEIIQCGISQLGHRLCVQDNQLSDHHEGHLTYKALKTLSRQGVTVGFQMLCSAVRNPGRQGSLKTSIDLGLAAGAQYFEIYQSDVLEEKQETMLGELAMKLK
jgi:hypothetical protein